MKNLGDYFTAYYGKFKQPFGNLAKGNIPFISSGDKNNGVVGFFEVKALYKNVISVARTGSVGSSFFHPYECCINSDCIILEPKEKFSKEEMFMFLLQLQKNIYRYSYSRKVTPERLLSTSISVKNLKPKKKIFLEKIQKKLSKSFLLEKYDLDVKKWKNFNLVNLFEITGTKTTTIKKLQEIGKGNFPYVTTQASNNGIKGFYDFYTEKGGVLTIDSAVLGYCSFQEKNFSASDHVEKLIPKFKINKCIGLFLSTLLNKEQYRFNYGRKASQVRLKTSKIKLPVDSLGNPDWEFMENYIKSLPYSESI